MSNAKENNIILEIDNSLFNDYERNKINKFSYIDRLNLLFQCAKECNIILDINAIINNIHLYDTILNQGILECLMKYTKENNIKDINILFTYAVFNNSINMVKVLIDYAKECNIILDFESRDSYDNYPLLYASMKNNIKIVELLIDYANQANIILTIDERNRNGECPLLWAIRHNNTKMVILLNKYNKENNINSEMKENNINNMLLNVFSCNNIEIIPSI